MNPCMKEKAIRILLYLSQKCLPRHGLLYGFSEEVTFDLSKKIILERRNRIQKYPDVRRASRSVWVEEV